VGGRSGDFGSGDPVGERGASAELAARRGDDAGAINPAVTQKTIDHTICARGWTRMVRPPVQYTEELKRQQIRTFGYHDRRLSQYEEDHLIPLGLGGAPADPRNLWPEPRTSPDGWGADRKDELEFALNQLVCAGRLPCERPSGRLRQTGSPPIAAMLDYLVDPTLRTQAHGKNHYRRPG
jgi:hypothetical protein